MPIEFFARVVIGKGNTQRTVRLKDYVFKFTEETDEELNLLHVDHGSLFLDKDPEVSKVNPNPVVYTPEHLEFLGRYSSEYIIGFSDSGKRYHVFLFRDKKIAVAECDRSQNAIYIFKMIDGWREQIDAAKSKVKTQPCFLQKIVHRGDWQGRVLKTIGLAG